jgi:hypothetical protein
MAICSPFLKSLDLADHGLEWLLPEIDLAHAIFSGLSGAGKPLAAGGILGFVLTLAGFWGGRYGETTGRGRASAWRCCCNVLPRSGNAAHSSS